MNIEHLLTVVDELSDKLNNERINLKTLEGNLSDKISERQNLLQINQLLEKVRVFLQEIAEVTRDQIILGLQEVVTLCLQSVFGDNIKFEIEVFTSRNATSIEFFVVTEENETIVRLKPEGSMGGGIIDTISIGLRFGLLKILNPLPAGPILLDEPAKMVSSDKIQAIGLLLKDLSKIFEKQVIMVTHHDLSDIADHSIYIEKTEGTSKVKDEWL